MVGPELPRETKTFAPGINSSIPTCHGEFPFAGDILDIDYRVAIRICCLSHLDNVRAIHDLPDGLISLGTQAMLDLDVD